MTQQESKPFRDLDDLEARLAQLPTIMDADDNLVLLRRIAQLPIDAVFVDSLKFQRLIDDVHYSFAENWLVGPSNTPYEFLDFLDRLAADPRAGDPSAGDLIGFVEWAREHFDVAALRWDGTRIVRDETVTDSPANDQRTAND